MSNVFPSPPRNTRTPPFWWHTAGLQYTSSGYGSRIPTRTMVKHKGRWRRVYHCIWSNSGTSYIDAETSSLINGKTRRDWIVVED